MLCTSTLALLAASSILTTVPSSGAQTKTQLRRQSAAFVENRGQWDDRALFLAQAPGAATWITADGLTVDVWTRGDRRRGHVLSMEFVGARRTSTEGHDLLPGVYNYLLGNRPENWTTDVRRFAEVRATELYSGIDARWYFDAGQPRYDFIVAPGANPGAIAMRWNGATSVRVQDGVLRLGTSLGNLQHRDLRAYQVVGGHEREVECRMVAEGKTVRFAVGEYDRSRPLVIDPVIFSTYFGGSGLDEIKDVRLDLAGRPIVVGYTYSSDFPTSAGAYDTTVSSRDVFAAKLTADGSGLVWGTYLGGSNNDEATALATTAIYEVAITGLTTSPDFPTLGAIDATLSGSGDGFVTLLAGNGKSLVFSTFLGGSNTDYGSAIQVDGGGRFIVAGDTVSADFPSASNVYSNSWDCFLTAIKADRSAIDYARYVGGTDLDMLGGLDLDTQGRAYLIGRTLSSDFPISGGAYDTTYAGTQSAFVARVNYDGGYFGTYLQGTSNAYGTSVRVDTDGSVVVAGYAGSGFPTTSGTYDQTHNGLPDHYVARLSGDLTTLMASTYIGGPGYEQGCEVEIMPNGTLAVLGQAASGYPTLGTSFNSNTYASMLMVLRLSADLSALTYSSSWEGTSVGNIRSAGGGMVVVAGGTQLDIAATGNAFQFDRLATDGSVAKFELVTSVVRSSARSFVGGVTNATGSIVLPAPAPAGGTPVALSTSYSTIEVPEIVTVPQGSKSVSFPIVSRTTLNPRDHVILTARWGARLHGIQLDVVWGGLKELVLQHNTLTGGRRTTGTVRLSGPAPSGGRTVLLSSSDPVAVVPSQAIIPEAADARSFPVTTSAVTVRHVVTLTATLKNETRTQTLVVNP